MLAPYTILLHSAGGSLSLFVFLWIEFFFKRRTHQSAVMHNFSLWFFFFTLFNFLSVMPLIFSLGSHFLNFGYTVSVILLLVGCVFVIRVPFILFPIRQNEILINVITAIILFLTLSVGVIQIIFPGAPHLDPSGKYIFWNQNFLSAFLTTYGLIGIALTFAIMFFRGAFGVEDEFTRVRSLLFAVGAISFANAANYYFGAKAASDLVLGLIFSLGGSFFIALGIVLADILKRHSGKKSGDVIKIQSKFINREVFQYDDKPRSN